jgi:hypothetical protein
MFKGLVSATFLATLALGTAHAETRNYDDRLTSRPTTAQRDREELQQWLRDFDARYSGGNSDNGNDFPSDQLNVIPGALANASAARAEFRRNYADLNRVVRWENEDFQNSPDMKAAVADQDAAYAAYQSERDRVLDNLSNDPVYQTALSLREEMGDKLTALHSYPKKDNNHIVAVANVKLSHASVARDLEAAALASDPDARDARARLMAASDRVSELRANFERNLRRSDSVQAARIAYEASRTARLAAEGYLMGAVQVANEALDYSYFIHRYDQFKYLSYGNSGYYYPYNNYPYYFRY